MQAGHGSPEARSDQPKCIHSQCKATAAHWGLWSHVHPEIETLCPVFNTGMALRWRLHRLADDVSSVLKLLK